MQAQRFATYRALVTGTLFFIAADFFTALSAIAVSTYRMPVFLVQFFVTKDTICCALELMAQRITSLLETFFTVVPITVLHYAG